MKRLYKNGYVDGLERAIQIICQQMGVSHWTDEDTIALLLSEISRLNDHKGMELKVTRIPPASHHTECGWKSCPGDKECFKRFE